MERPAASPVRASAAYRVLGLTAIVVGIALTQHVSQPFHAQSPYEVLATFNREDVGIPETGVIRGVDGAFYGTAWDTWDDSRQHTVFRWSPDGSFTWMTYPSTGTFRNPSPLIQASDGDFYFSQWDGSCENGAGGGCLIRLRWGLRFYDFHVLYDTIPEGAYPQQRLLEGADGNFYATSSFGYLEENLYGTVFRVDPSKPPIVDIFKPPPGRVTVLHRFSDDYRPEPYLVLIKGRDGGIYQMRYPWRDGVFKRASDGNFYSTFKIIEGSDRALYGSEPGGLYGRGHVFRTDASGVRETLHNFDGVNGGLPSGPLLEADGYLYGTTGRGGPFNNGVLFRLRVDTLSPSRSGPYDDQQPARRDRPWRHASDQRNRVE